MSPADAPGNGDVPLPTAVATQAREAWIESSPSAHQGDKASNRPTSLSQLRDFLAHKAHLGSVVFGTGLRLIGLAATFRISALRSETTEAIRLWRSRRLILRSGVFDTDFYASQLKLQLREPILHYLRHGIEEARWPHPLFDTAWYVEHNSDVRSSGVNPLIHYLTTWRSEGRRTNAFFDPRWYLQTHAQALASGLDPLTHYMEIGAHEDADPSPDFDTRWYREQNRAALATDLNPLAHFLHWGRHEARLPRMRASRLAHGRPVEEAELHCLHLEAWGDETALFVTHAPQGRLKPHLRHYLQALSDQRIDVILIVASDKPFDDVEPWLRPLVKGLFVRANLGYDFAAWAHLLRRYRELNNARILYFLNDSLFGPTHPDAFGAIISRIRSSQADLIGLTDNRERGWHIQSYFLAIKQRALSSVAFQEFMHDIVSFKNKEDVINTFEIQLAPTLLSSGLKVEALFQALSDYNPTIHHWKELLDKGFPFIKVMAIRDDIPTVDKSGWEIALSSKGYDVSLVEATLAEIVRDRELEATVWSGALAKTDHPSASQATRVGFFGPWNYDNGLGNAARGYISALMQTQYDLGIYSVHRPFHIHKRLTPSIDFSDFDAGCDVAIVHLNPTTWGALLDDHQLKIITGAKIRIGLFTWESKTVPASFIEGFKSVDRIWAPSSFCADAFKAVTDKPVDIIPHVVEPVVSSASERRLERMSQRLGLNRDVKIVLYIFDASSYVARKNPAALIRAFRNSGLGERGWKLVLKTKYLDRMEAGCSELIALIHQSSDVVLFEGNLSAADLGTLLDLASIYASSHCSEGFGLTIAEALARGKPVVATDYGGSRDFLTNQTGFPVRCHEVQLEQDEGPYARGTLWAMVDEEHLAACLLAASSVGPARRRQLETASYRMIADRLSSRAVAARIKASIERLPL